MAVQSLGWSMVLRTFLFTLPLTGVLFTACTSKNTTSSSSEEAKPLTPIQAKQLFESKCSVCHGCDGTLGMSGAKDLSVSRLTDEQIKEIVLNGKNAMPSFQGMIEEGDQLDKIVSHVKSLRK